MIEGLQLIVLLLIGGVCCMIGQSVERGNLAFSEIVKALKREETDVDARIATLEREMNR